MMYQDPIRDGPSRAIEKSRKEEVQEEMKKWGLGALFFAIFIMLQMEGARHGADAALLDERAETTNEQTVSTSDLIETVKRYAEQNVEEERMVEFEPGVWVKHSNIHGVRYEGETYYYSLWPHMSYDPVTRGDWSREEITIVYQEREGTHPIVIYKKKEREA